MSAITQVSLIALFRRILEYNINVKFNIYIEFLWRLRYCFINMLFNAYACVIAHKWKHQSLRLFFLQWCRWACVYWWYHELRCVQRHFGCKPAEVCKETAQMITDTPAALNKKNKKKLLESKLHLLWPPECVADAKYCPPPKKKKK